MSEIFEVALRQCPWPVDALSGWQVMFQPAFHGELWVVAEPGGQVTTIQFEPFGTLNLDGISRPYVHSRSGLPFPVATEKLAFHFQRVMLSVAEAQEWQEQFGALVPAIAEDLRMGLDGITIELFQAGERGWSVWSPTAESHPAQHAFLLALLNLLEAALPDGHIRQAIPTVRHYLL